MNVWILDFLNVTTAETLGWTLVHAVWQIAALVFGVVLLDRCAANRWVRTRYAMGLIAMAAMLVVPGMTFRSLYAVPVPLPRPVLVNADGAGRTLEIIPDDAGVAANLGVSVVSPPPRMDAALASRPDTVRWPVLLSAGWGLGVCFFGLRLLLGWGRLRHQIARSRPVAEVSDDWSRRFNAVARGMGVGRRVSLRIQSGVGCPLVTGFLRPTLLFPAALLSGLTPAQVEYLLKHELAHVRRWDPLAIWFQTVVETLLFFHPGVWWLGRRTTRLREQCCDDAVARQSGDRRAYAGSLVALAEALGPVRPGASPKLVAAADGGELEPRIRRLLGAGEPPRRGAALPAALVGVAVLVAAGMWAAPGDNDPVGGALESQVVDATESEDERADSAPGGVSEPAADTETIRVDYASLLAGDLSQNLRMRAGDVLLVPPANRGFVFIVGGERPGAYTIPRELTLKQLVASSGGVPAALLGQDGARIVLQRRVNGQNFRTSIPARPLAEWEVDVWLEPDDMLTLDGPVPEVDGVTDVEPGDLPVAPARFAAARPVGRADLAPPPPWRGPIEVGDTLRYSLGQQGFEEARDIEVMADGTIDVPGFARVSVAGESIAAAQASVRAAIRRELDQNIDVEPIRLGIAKRAAMTFSVLAERTEGGTQPAVYPLPHGDVRLLDAVAGAGGVAQQIEELFVIRRRSVGAEIGADGGADARADAGDPPSVEDVIAALGEASARIDRLGVEFTGVVQRQTDPGVWEDTPEGMSGAVWYENRVGGRLRLRVDRQISPWIDGAASWVEHVFEAGFDGETGTTVRHTNGVPGNPGPDQTVLVERGLPTGMTSDSADVASGRAFNASLGLFWSWRSVADTLRALRDDGEGVRVARETLGTVDTVRVDAQWGGEDRLSASLWLDPARGYTLLGVDHFRAGERVSRARVERLEEVLPGAWLPTWAWREENRLDPRLMPEAPADEASNQTSLEDRIEASSAPARYRTELRGYKVNDPALGDAAFVVEVPNGYERIDWQ